MLSAALVPLLGVIRVAPSARVQPPLLATSTNLEPVQQLPLTPEVPCDFDWWGPECSALVDDLESRGGERFVAWHDESGFDTRNWLHVTASSPARRAQYEMRYVESDQLLSGIARFGEDCEGPPGCTHGGCIATVADAATATATFKAAGRMGLTTKLECNYREMLPLCTPVRLEARVTVLKPRRSSVEWQLLSLTSTDKDGAPTRHAFGTADFLLERAPK